MITQKISPSAYALRLQWEKEDSAIFQKFHKEKGSMEVINALAELIIQMQNGIIPKQFQFLKVQRDRIRPLSKKF